MRTLPPGGFGHQKMTSFYKYYIWIYNMVNNNINIEAETLVDDFLRNSKVGTHNNINIYNKNMTNIRKFPIICIFQYYFFNGKSSFSFRDFLNWFRHFLNWFRHFLNWFRDFLNWFRKFLNFIKPFTDWIFSKKKCNVKGWHFPAK